MTVLWRPRPVFRQTRAKSSASPGSASAAPCWLGNRAKTCNRQKSSFATNLDPGGSNFMKIHCKKINQDGASVLLITLGVCTILGILMLSYLSMAKTQAFSVTRAQAWNYALVVAEAGVEDGMAEVSATNAFKNFNASPGNGWQTNSGFIYKTNSYLGGSGSNYYNVYIYWQPNAGVAPTADKLHPVIIS